VFEAAEKDMTEAIEAMEKALEVLGEIGQDQKKAELLTVNSNMKNFMSNWGKGSLLKLKTTLKSAFQAASAHLTLKQRSTFDSFIQAPFTGTYTSQSGEIVGILKNMKDTFEANLEQAKSNTKFASRSISVEGINIDSRVFFSYFKMSNGGEHGRVVIIQFGSFILQSYNFETLTANMASMNWSFSNKVKHLFVRVGIIFNTWSHADNNSPA
jgi:hypothetical protein